jgi:hypothetical protein
MGTSAGSGGPGGTGGTGSAVPAGAGGAAVPAGTGGTAGTSGTTGPGGGVPVTGESLGEGQMRAGTIQVNAKRSDAGDPDNPEADEFIAKAKADKKERQEKARRAALEGAVGEDEADRLTGQDQASSVNKGQQGDAASGGKRKGGKPKVDSDEEV